MHGKPLSALLQILRAHGVTSYETPQLKLTLGAAPARRAPKDAIEINVSPEALDAERRQELEDDDGPPGGDWRFALETSPKARRIRRPFPTVKADPRKNPQ